MAKADALTPAELKGAVEAQPICGVTHAAKLLGIAPPNFRRYRDRLTAIPVEGAADVFVVAEVKALRDELRS